MVHTITIQPKAEEDLKKAYRWYEKRLSGLGFQFIEQVEVIFDQISKKPKIYPVVYRNIRRGLLKRFPYAVFYIIEPRQIVVLAVLHQARDPNRWKQRKQ